MSTKLAVVLAVGCGAGLLWGTSVNAHTREEAPSRQIALVVDSNARHGFFDRLGAFATREAFEFRITPTRPGEEYFVVTMWREDIDIVALNSLEPQAFNVYFYLHKAHKMTEAQVDALVTEFKDSVVSPGGARLAPDDAK